MYFCISISTDELLFASQRVNSYEECAELCCAYGFTGPQAVAGVEYKTQCFCGKSFNPSPGSMVPMSQCGKACPNNQTEQCGDADRIVVFSSTCAGKCSAPPAPPQPSPSPPSPSPPGSSVPNWMPCEVEPAKSMPFCDHTLPTAERVAHLISLMTQDELCQQTYDKMGTIAKVPSWKGREFSRP